MVDLETNATEREREREQPGAGRSMQCLNCGSTAHAYKDCDAEKCG